MREVIYIEQKKDNDKPVEFTHKNLNNNDGGWTITKSRPEHYDNVVYRGFKGGYDYFCCWDNGVMDTIGLFRGHLNSGKY